MRYLLLLALAAFAGAPVVAQTCSTSWAAPVDGDWDDASKWTDGVPASGEDACIIVPGTYTVTIRPDYGTAISLQTLTLGGASGTQTFVSGGVLSVGDMTIGENAAAEFIPGTVAGTFPGLSASGTVLVEGIMTANYNGVRGIVRDGGTLEVASGGTLQGTDGARLGGSGRTFTIRGTAELSDGGRIDARTEVLGGTVRATSGQGQLFSAGGGILQNATLDAASGATLSIEGNYVLEGTISGSPQGEVGFSTGTVTAAASGVTLNMTGQGVRFGTGVQRQTVLTGGPVLNTGRLVFVPNFFATLQGTTLTNESTLDLEGNLNMTEGAVIRNRPSGVITMVGTQLTQNPNTSVVRVENAGLIVREDPGGVNASRFVSVTLESLPGSEIRVFGDYLNFTSGPTADVLPPGMMLTGNGNVITGAGLPIRSTFSPGTEADPIGTLGPRPLGTFILAPEAITVLDVAADGVSDQMDVTGIGASMTLGGTLRVRVAPSVTPAFGDQWIIVVNGQSRIQGAFDAIEVEGAPEDVSFAVDLSNPTRAVLLAVASVSVSAPLASAQEGTPLSFVLTHPASPEPFAINVETDGTATRFADYTLSATRGVVYARANTTQTTVQVFPRRDADAAEGDETLTLRVVQGFDAIPGATAEASVTIQDGPSNTELAIDGISPARGGNIGTVTPMIYGTGFGSDATVHLQGPTTVTGSRPSVAAVSTGVSATFDLAGAPVGAYDVVATSDGQTATLPGAFTVVGSAGGVPLSGSVTGTPAPRLGRKSTYTVRVHNDGDVDIYDAMVLIRVTGGVAYSVSGVRSAADTGPGDTGPGLPTDGASIVPVYIYRVPAGATLSARVTIMPTTEFFGQLVGVAAELYPPNPEATVTYSGRLADLEADAEAGRWTVWGTVWGSFELMIDGIMDGIVDGLPPLASSSREAFAFREGDECGESTKVLPGPAGTSGLTSGNSMKDVNELYSSNERLRDNWSIFESATPNPGSEFLGYALGSFITLGVAALEAAGVIAIGVGALPIVAAGVITMASFYFLGELASSVGLSSRVYCAGGQVGASGDPNDKLGPAGVSAERYYVPDDGPTPYIIRFENMPTASFPAQEVIVVDTLDTAVFDLSTFSFGPIAWGDTSRLVPSPGAHSFEADVSLAPALAASLLVTASLDVTTGRVVWHFTTLNPATNDLPEDGTIGFLPPNQTQSEGEGSLAFTVRTREGLPTGTEVSNGAEIIFDVNEPILTPVWTNTVDISAPTSSVQPLAGTESNPVTLSISGSDAGSGIGVYTVYASQDGGAFEFVGQSTDGTFEFEGESSSTYGFYSIAADRTQNLEGPKTEAEATTMIAVTSDGGPVLPLTLTLEAPRPNPVSELVRLRYGVPRAGDASVRVLDALGREVATLVSGEAAAGWHTAEWQPSVASGVYVVELRAGNAVQHQRVTVVR